MSNNIEFIRKYTSKNKKMSELIVGSVITKLKTKNCVPIFAPTLEQETPLIVDNTNSNSIKLIPTTTLSDNDTIEVKMFLKNPSIESIITDTYKYYIIFQNPNTLDYFLISSTNTSNVDSYDGNETVFWDYSASGVKFYKLENDSWIEVSMQDVPSLKWRITYSDGTKSQLQIYYDRDYGVKFINCLKYSNYNINTVGGDSFFAQNLYEDYATNLLYKYYNNTWTRESNQEIILSNFITVNTITTNQDYINGLDDVIEFETQV